MKEVGEDGAHTFFSTVSHDLKRHAQIYCDYQLKDQVPLRIRGNAEYFINIKHRKTKLPFILTMYYLPFKGLKTLIEKLIKAYELKKHSLNSIVTGKNVIETTAKKICKITGIPFDELFDKTIKEEPYAEYTKWGKKKLLKAIFEFAISTPKNNQIIQLKIIQ